MTPAEVAAKLRAFNEWRRGDYEPSEQPAPPDPCEIGEAIDAAIEMIDRLEAAESDALEQARLNGMGGEREAALLSKLEAAEKERDTLRTDKATLQQMTYSLKDRVEVVEKEYRHMLEVKEIYQRQLNETEDERDALRAKIEAMEKQEPVYLFRRKGLDDFCTCSKERYESFSAKPRLFEVKTLYALPGAKGEEK
jgi:hypothetical protein